MTELHKAQFVQSSEPFRHGQLSVPTDLLDPHPNLIYEITSSNMPLNRLSKICPLYAKGLLNLIRKLVLVNREGN